jgi:large subunit ribosomal protein L10
MALPEKRQTIETLREKLAGSSLALLTEYRGLTVAQMTFLRSELRRSHGEYLVMKNTLARIALEGSKYRPIEPLLTGPTGWVFGRRDSISIVKLVAKFAAEMEGFTIKGGVFEGDFLDASGIKELSQLLNRDHVLAQLLSVIQGCGTKVVRILSEPGRRVVRVLDEIQKSKNPG